MGRLVCTTCSPSRHGCSCRCRPSPRCVERPVDAVLVVVAKHVIWTHDDAGRTSGAQARGHDLLIKVQPVQLLGRHRRPSYPKRRLGFPTRQTGGFTTRTPSPAPPSGRPRGWSAGARSRSSLLFSDGARDHWPGFVGTELPRAPCHGLAISGGRRACPHRRARHPWLGRLCGGPARLPDPKHPVRSGLAISLAGRRALASVRRRAFRVGHRNWLQVGRRHMPDRHRRP